MRIALVSDVHGHPTAFDAELADLAVEVPGRVVCLGDVALNGPVSLGVQARLHCRGWPMATGDTEAWIPRFPVRQQCG